MITDYKSYMVIKVGSQYYHEINNDDYEFVNNIDQAEKLDSKLDLWKSMNGYAGFIYNKLKKEYPDKKITTIHICKDKDEKWIELDGTEKVW